MSAATLAAAAAAAAAASQHQQQQQIIPSVVSGLSGVRGKGKREENLGGILIRRRRQNALTDEADNQFPLNQQNTLLLCRALMESGEE